MTKAAVTEPHAHDDTAPLFVGIKATSKRGALARGLDAVGGAHERARGGSENDGRYGSPRMRCVR